MTNLVPAVTTRRAALGGMAASLATVTLPAVALGQTAASDGVIRLPHAFGEAVLPKPAVRVVSLGLTTHDALLALGVVPLAVRYWFGDQPDAVFPWARDRLQGAKPVVIAGEVSAEIVTSLRPDLIVGIGSGISQAEYAILSRIAPTLMQTEDQPSYGVPWDDLVRILGRATGRDAAATALVSGTRERFAAVKARHPGWNNRTAVAAYHFSGETGGYTRGDFRGRFLAELGFAPAPEIDRRGAGNFYVAVSPEDLSPLDVDLLVWIASEDAVPSENAVADLVSLPMRRVLRAHREGREVFAGGMVAAALSFGSVLSIPFALDALEADFAAALDGDPATLPASAVAAGLAP